jgi:hypothetical protein
MRESHSPIMGRPAHSREDRNCAAVILFVDDVALDKRRGQSLQQHASLC